MPALKTKIARQLAASRVGLYRVELFAAVHGRLIADKIDALAAALQGMEQAGDIEPAARTESGPRWQLTAKGRAAYSALNGEDQDDPDGIDQKTEKIALLEIIEASPLVSVQNRQLVAGIRADLAALDAAD